MPLSVDLPAVVPCAAWRTALIALLFWSAVALIFVLPHLAATTNWRALVLSALAQWWAWGLLSPAILGLNAWLPFSSGQWPLRVVVQVVLGVAFALAYVLVEGALAALFGIATWSALMAATSWQDAWHGLFWSLLVYGLVVGVGEAQRYQRRYVDTALAMAQVERSFSQARLLNLRAQLDPHFLFNALNTISSQVEREPKLARNMIEHLGDLLRMSLASQHRQWLSLQEELGFVQHYLAIQRIRFGEALRVSIEVEAGLENQPVPSLMLQPLVENAIRHGLTPRAALGQVWLRVYREGGALWLSVADDGVGLSPDWHAGEGLGLSTTRQRLEGLYQGRASIDVRARAAGGTEVTIRIPLADEASHG